MQTPGQQLAFWLKVIDLEVSVFKVGLLDRKPFGG